MRTAVSIVWCLLLASVALQSSVSFQGVSLLSDSAVVSNSAFLCLRALCSVSVAIIVARRLA